MCDYKTISYCEFGCGENILLLHGWGANKFLWGNLTDLSVDYHIWCVDLWGFGDSKSPNRQVGSFEYATGIANFIQNVIKENVILIGHSFGGKIASIVASETNLVSKLILIDSAGLPARFNLRKFILKVRYAKAKKKVAAGKLNSSYLDRFGSVDYKHASKTMRAVLVKVVNENITKNLKRISIPTLIIWGRQDNDTPLYMAKTMRKVIKNSKLIVLDGGHFCFLDSNILPYIYKFLENDND